MLMMLSRSFGGPSLHLSTLAVLGVLILGYGCSDAAISGDLVTDTSVIDAVFEVAGGTDSAEIRVEPRRTKLRVMLDLIYATSPSPGFRLFLNQYSLFQVTVFQRKSASMWLTII